MIKQNYGYLNLLYYPNNLIFNPPDLHSRNTKLCTVSPKFSYFSTICALASTIHCQESLLYLANAQHRCFPSKKPSLILHKKESFPLWGYICILHMVPLLHLSHHRLIFCLHVCFPTDSNLFEDRDYDTHLTSKTEENYLHRRGT